MKRAIIVASERADHQQTWGGAFAEGLRRHGWHATVQKSAGPCDLLAIWGVRRDHIIREQKQSGGEMVILERGYLADRFDWTSVSFGGGLNGRAEFRGPFEDPSRWQKHFAHLMQTWQNRDGVALICGQVATDAAVRHVDIEAFYQHARTAFEKLGFKVRFRAHPLAKNYIRRAPSRPLAEDLAQAAVAITYNSNSGVEAVLAGVPTVAMDKGSMAWDVTGHAFALPPTPDRTAWAHALAWKQWRMDEIAAGTCWDAIGRERVAA